MANIFDMKPGPWSVVEETPSLDIRQAFRLVEIAHETSDLLVRNAALEVLRLSMNPMFVFKPDDQSS